MDKVHVYNTETGDKRFMGNSQFENWGKNNGFKLVPEGGDLKINKENQGDSGPSIKDVKASNDDSGNDDSGNTENEIKKISVADSVTAIEDISKDESLSNEEKSIKIEAFKINETRPGVLKAVLRFGESITEKDA
jgi:hypothetical protein